MWTGGVVYLCALIVLCSSHTAAQTAQEVLENVRKTYDSITDVRIVFTQRVKFSIGRVDQTGGGTLLMKKDNKYRLEMDDQTVVTDGRTVWSYSRPAHQVLIDSFKQNDHMLTPDRILGGAPDDFTPALLGKERIGKVDAIGLKLLPKQDDPFIRSLKLWVDPKEWLVRKAEVSDVHGKETSYTVTEIKTDTGVPDARFVFQIPEGAEVVDLR